MLIHRSMLLCVPLTLVACTSPTSQNREAQFNESISTFQRVESRVKSGVSPATYPYLVAGVNVAIAQLPTDTPPRVRSLLHGSATAYSLAFKYWQCDQKAAGSDQATCRDSELEKAMTHFPRIKRNITRRLVLRPNPPTYLSSSITPTNMLQLLLMQAELNRVDAHLILTGGKFDNVYSSAS